MSLPTAWVDRIFDKMTLIYGQSFLRRWADIDLNAVKSDWAHELAGFAQSPKAIAYGLQHLPIEKPPTVLEFKALCRRMPHEEQTTIEAPQADPERVARELAKLGEIKRREAGKDHKQWARDILERAKSGKNVPTITVIEFARRALRHDQN